MSLPVNRSLQSVVSLPHFKPTNYSASPDDHHVRHHFPVSDAARNYLSLFQQPHQEYTMSNSSSVELPKHFYR